MEFNTHKTHDIVKVSAHCDMGERCSEQQSLCMQKCVTEMIVNLCNAALSLDMQHGIGLSSMDTKIEYIAHQGSVIIAMSSTIEVNMSDKVFDMFSTMLMSINKDIK